MRPKKSIQQTGKYSGMERMSVTYYTDPLCCWSWAMQGVIANLKAEFPGLINWRYCMGGLLPSWDGFSDPLNSVSRPLQMGPVWMHASRVSGVPIDHNLWFRDPPASSYPACIAFKSIQLQSREYAESYLRLLWEKCIGEGVNIARQDELIKLAQLLKSEYPVVDIEKFTEDLTNGNGRKAFSEDINEVRTKGITRFPTMIFRKKGSPSLLITGYRPYSALAEVVTKLLSGQKKMV
jgi:predicted DsbA family dithiol-disulfide isomerase